MYMRTRGGLGDDWSPEGPIVEMVVRRTGSDVASPGKVINTVGGRLLGRYWYNPADGATQSNAKRSKLVGHVSVKSAPFRVGLTARPMRWSPASSRANWSRYWKYLRWKPASMSDIQSACTSSRAFSSTAASADAADIYGVGGIGIGKWKARWDHARQAHARNAAVVCARGDRRRGVQAESWGRSD